MQVQWDPLGALGLGLMVAILALAVFVYFSAPSRPANRWLALNLVMEAFASEATLVALLLVDYASKRALGLVLSAMCATAGVFLYLGLLGTVLETPLVRPLKARPVRWALIALAVLGASLVMLAEDPFTVWRYGLLWITLAIFSFGAIAALDAYRRTPRGTLVRQRALAFARAFVTRDVGIIIVVLLNTYAAGGFEGGPEATVFDAYFQIAVAMYLGFLIYGILKTQLFDIDVKIRWTLHRGTVAALFIGVFLVVMQVAQNALNQRFGWIWGGVAAGLLLLAFSPIQRLAERISHAATPGAKHLARLSIEERADFYADHVRAAWEDGSIDRSDRTLLNSLRAKLGLSAEAAGKLEVEITSA